MIKKLLVLWLVACSPLLYAQTIKTDVLVIGGSPSGVAAAIQAARSKVKTILAFQDFKLGVSGEKFMVFQNQQLSFGIWSEFRNRIRDKNNSSRPVHSSKDALPFEKKIAESVLKEMTDSVKDLVVEPNVIPSGIKKEGDQWDVHFLRDGKNLDIKARVVIDATENAYIAGLANKKAVTEFNPRQVRYGSTIYRTAIAVGNEWPGARPTDNTIYSYWNFPVRSLIDNGNDNLIATEGLLPTDKNIEYLPVQLEVGQGAGAIAAYCAFFKTDTKNLNVRKIQGELLDFKSYIIPFIDVDQTDGDWRAIQQIGATGLLKGQTAATGFYFLPDAPASTAEIEPVLTEIYTRAFLWFRKEKPGEKFTVANTLSLISDYTLTDPGLLKATLQKAWKTQYKFTTDFDLNRPITRREFAVLINKYLNPFARTVDLEGRFLN